MAFFTTCPKCGGELNHPGECEREPLSAKPAQGGDYVLMPCPNCGLMMPQGWHSYAGYDYGNNRTIPPRISGGQYCDHVPADGEATPPQPIPTPDEAMLREISKAADLLRQCRVSNKDGKRPEGQKLLHSEDALRKLYDALAALKPFLGGWQTDMENAPKDGTPVLLFARHVNATAPVRLVGHYNGEDFGWIAVSFVPHGPMQIVPFAWQPLPASPDKGGE